MTIYTMGFTQKSAKHFFELIKNYNINILLDIRLNNKSQLAGFTKGDDLSYFLSEICKCKYKHCIEYAPTKEILDEYKKKKITWNEYVDKYISLIQRRDNIPEFFESFHGYENICLLCSEPTPEHCHRRLLVEMISQSNPQIIIKHI
jgi:uncharacterized protein (DUF488 family)